MLLSEKPFQLFSLLGSSVMFEYKDDQLLCSLIILLPSVLQLHFVTFPYCTLTCCVSFDMQGYYDFSQKLKHIARLPFATIAYGEQYQTNLRDALNQNLSLFYKL